MLLHELPRGALFVVDNGKILETGNEPVYRLDHLDGMYSVCYDRDNRVTHWAVFTPVIPMKEIQ